jgi:hypothetical protein
VTKLQIVNLSPDQHKASIQNLAESCGFIPNRFGKNFGYEASTAAILRLVAKVKEQTEAENKEIAPELYPKNSATINLYQT